MALIPGVEPLLVFYFPQSTLLVPLFSAIGITENLGLPVPFYLTPKFGFAWQSDANSLSIDTQVTPLHPFDPKTGALIPNAKDKEVTQRGITANLTISFRAEADNLLVTALINLADQILGKVIKQDYQIHYFNGSTVLIGALLADFTTNSSNDSNMLDCTIVLSRAAKKQTIELPDIQSLSPISLPAVKLPGPGNLLKV